MTPARRTFAVSVRWEDAGAGNRHERASLRLLPFGPDRVGEPFARTNSRAVHYYTVNGGSRDENIEIHAAAFQIISGTPETRPDWRRENRDGLRQSVIIGNTDAGNAV